MKKKKVIQPSQFIGNEFYRLSESIRMIHAVAMINDDKKALYWLSKIGTKVFTIRDKILFNKNYFSEQHLKTLFKKYQKAFQSIDIVFKRDRRISSILDAWGKTEKTMLNQNKGINFNQSLLEKLAIVEKEMLAERNEKN